MKQSAPPGHFSQRGTVTFPGESPKPIRRLPIDAQPSLADKLFGEWYAPLLKRRFVFNQDENGRIKSEDGSLSCAQTTAERPDLVNCQFLDGETTSFSLPLLNQGSTWIQIRDRFGNLQGLGKLDE